MSGKTDRMTTWLPAALIFSVVACAGPGVPIGTGASPEEIERQAIVPAPTEGAAQRTEAVLASYGFEPTETQGLYRTAEGANRSWAYCEIFTYRVFEQFIRVRPRTMRVEASPLLEPAAGGTSVTIVPTFVGIYQRPDGVGTFERPCNSFGVLEQELFAELRAAA